MKSIASLQNRILSKAIAQGSTVNSKPVRRIGETGASKAASMLGGIVGGVLFSVATKTSHMSDVYGNKVKITKKGDKHIRLYDKEGLSEYEKRSKGP